jgi:hypothetical protein
MMHGVHDGHAIPVVSSARLRCLQPTPPLSDGLFEKDDRFTARKCRPSSR